MQAFQQTYHISITFLPTTYYLTHKVAETYIKGNATTRVSFKLPLPTMKLNIHNKENAKKSNVKLDVITRYNYIHLKNTKIMI